MKTSILATIAVMSSMLTSSLAAEKTPDFLAKVQLHNFDGYEPTPDGAGVTVYRLPAGVRAALSPEGARQTTHARGGEIRFVLNEGAKLEDVVIHLKSNRASTVMYYRGDELVGRIQGLRPKKDAVLYIPPSMREIYKVTRDDLAVEASLKPAAIKASPQSEVSGDETAPKRFSGQVHRIALNGGVITLTGIEGDIRPPHGEEVPPVLVSYGTSISMGAAASRPDFSFTALTARALGMSLRNIGVSGNAFCEPQMADYLAEQPAALYLLEISVNMLGNGYPPGEFEKRAGYMIDRIAGKNPDVPVFCISVLPHNGEKNPRNTENVKAYRETLERLCKESKHKNVHFVSGPELMSFEGLSKDGIHPADQGMAEIAKNLIPKIQEILKKE